MSKTELMVCPICGEKPHSYTHFSNDSSDVSTTIECCFELERGKRYGYYETKDHFVTGEEASEASFESAAKVWNRLANLQKENEEFKHLLSLGDM